jgi:iron complex outermembrane receptor protein
MSQVSGENHNMTMSSGVTAGVIKYSVATCASLFSFAILVSGMVEAADESSTSSDVLETIVVTAQKRSEDLKDVPISIDVLSGAQLQQQQITSLDDLARAVPDLANAGPTGGTAPGQGNYEIRGVSGAGTFTAIGQATIGTYLDDISTTVPTGAGVGATELKLFDLDHVEVLRGPQGTLYGASSMGGTIRFISNQPDLNNFGGSALTEVSDTQHAHGSLNYVEQGVLNLPISTGVLAVRLGVQYSQQAGYIDVESPYDTGQITYKGLNDDRSTVFRASIKYQSPDSDLVILPSIYILRETFGGDSQYDPNPPTPALTIPQFITPTSFDNVTLPSLTIEKSVFGATLTSASSYFQRDSDHSVDGTEELETAVAPAWPTSFALPNTVHQFSEELRLTSKSMKESGLPISWVGGIYLADLVDNTYAISNFLGNLNNFDQLLINSGDSYLIPQLKTYPGGNDLFSQYTHYQLYQTAVFGEFSYSPFAHFTATAGLRESISHEAVTEYVGGYFQWFGNNGGTVVEPGSARSHTLAPKFALRYDFSDNVSVYANAVEGFRLGGANGPVPLSTGCLYSLHQIGLNSAPLSYAPDTLWSYELGTKSSFFSNRLSVDASAFYITWNKVQQGITVPGTVTDPCGSGFVGNAGDAVSDGVDVDLHAKVTTHLTLGVAGNVTHAIITQPAPFTGTTYGSHLLGVPGWATTVSANYSAPLTGTLSGFLDADMDWVGRSYGVFDPTASGYDFPAYGRLNVRAGIAFGNVQLSLFAKNALNEDKDIQPGQYPFLTPAGTVFYTATTLTPRTVGISASVKF